MQPAQDQNFWQAEPQAEAPQPSTDMATNDSGRVIDQPLSWQASEYIHHEKSGLWFLTLFAVAVVLLVVDAFLIQSWTFAALIVVMTIAAMIVARRPPRTVNYSLSPQGIHIDEKLFSFHEFRAFGVVQQNAFYSVRLIPNKRFMPLVSIFFPAELGEQIVDVFGSMLPMESIEPDFIDSLVEKLRF